VADRVEAGHWEGDLMMEAGNRSAIGTLGERTTSYLVLLPFPDGISTTDGSAQAITDAPESVPAGLRRTLTWDHGKDLAQHQQITGRDRRGRVLLRRALAVAAGQQTRT
jgi:IS30 family transposase